MAATNPNIKLTVDNKRFIAAFVQSAGAVGRFTAETNIRLANWERQQSFINSRVEQGLGKLAGRFESAGKKMMMGFTAPLAAAGLAAANSYKEYSSLSTAINYVDGSAEKGSKSMRDLQNMAKAPGLGLEEAMQGYTRLRALGFEAEKTKKLIGEIANANAQTGGGKSEFDTILFQLSQMSSKGKILSEDLKPILSASPVIAKTIQNLFGTVDSEAISKSLKNAGKDSKYFIELLTTELSKGQRVAGTFKSAVENISDTLFISGARMMEVVDKTFNLQGGINALTSKIEGLVDSFVELDPVTQRQILALAALAAGVGPAVYAIGQLIRANAAIVQSFGAVSSALTNPYVLATIAVVGLTTALISSYKALNPVVTSSEELANINKEVNSSTQAEISGLNKLYKTAGDITKTTEERKSALQSLQNQYPDYFGKMNAEKISIRQLDEAYYNLSNSIIASAKSRAAAAKLEELAKKRMDVEQTMIGAKIFKDDKQLARRTSMAITRSQFGSLGLIGEVIGDLQASFNSKVTDNQYEGAVQQLEEIDRAMERLQDQIITTREEGKKPLKPMFPGAAEELKKRRDDTAKLLEMINNYQAVGVEEEGRRKQAKIEAKYENERLRIVRTIAAFETQILALSENRKAEEREIADIRRAGAIKELVGNNVLNPINHLSNSKADRNYYIKNRTNELGKQATEEGRDRTQNYLSFSEKERLIAATNGIDLEKPLARNNQILMDSMLEMNNILNQAAIDAFVGMGNVIGQMIAGTKPLSALPQMLGGIIGGMFESIGQKYIEFGVLTSGLIPTLANPFTAGPAAIAAGVALVALGSGMKAVINKPSKPTKLAQGGMFTKSTYAEIGEYTGAATDPEGVGKLSKFVSMMDPYIRDSVKSAVDGGTISSTTDRTPIINVNFDRRGVWENVVEEQKKLNQKK